MAIGDAYCSTATYRALLGKSDTAEDAEILDDLTGISRWMERKLGRHFTQDAAAVARAHYAGRDLVITDGGRGLWIPDVATKTGFALKRDDDQDGVFSDETAWTIDTDFQLWPLNAENEPEAQPWRKIVIPTWSAKDLFAAGDYLQITSKEGWPAIPKPIERACAHITAHVRLETPRATKRIAEGIEGAAEESEFAANIIAQLALAYGRHAKVLFA